MAAGPFGLGAPSPLGHLRGVIDPQTGLPYSAADPTPDPNAVAQRSWVLPVGSTNAGAVVPAAPAPINAFGRLAVDAVKGAPDSLVNAATLVPDAWSGRLNTTPTQMSQEEGLRIADAAGSAMVGSMPFPAPAGALRMFGGRNAKNADLGALAQQTTQASIDPIRAFHGSPHDFDRFDISKIGTGEGAQAYGHGLYFAENEGVARSYRDNLTQKGTHGYDPLHTSAKSLVSKMGGDPDWAAEVLRDQLSGIDPKGLDAQRFQGILEMITSGKWSKPPPGHMYEVGIHADPAKMLDWDAPLRAHPRATVDALYDAGVQIPRSFDTTSLREMSKGDPSSWYGQQANFIDEAGLKKAGQVYGEFAHTDPARASQALKEAGVPGIRFLDQGSRFTSNAEMLGTFPQGSGYVAKIRATADHMPGSTQPPPPVITTSKVFPTAEEALKWGQGKVADQGTRNYVTFSDDIVSILRKYGLAGAIGAGAAMSMPRDAEAAPGPPIRGFGQF